MLTVGQELWYVPTDSRDRKRSCSVRVEKVGRKWADLNDYYGRVNVETLYIDGGRYSSPGRCWPSKKAWGDEVKRVEAWRDLQSRLGHSPPDHANLEMIKTIRRMLFSQ